MRSRMPPITVTVDAATVACATSLHADTVRVQQCAAVWVCMRVVDQAKLRPQLLLTESMV